MFVRKKKYPSGNIGVIVVEKIGGKMKELATIGVAHNEDEVENLVNEAKVWISKKEARRVLSNVSNTILGGCDLILDRTFDGIGFNRIDGEVKVAINCFISHANVSRLLHVSASWL